MAADGRARPGSRAGGPASAGARGPQAACFRRPVSPSPPVTVASPPVLCTANSCSESRGLHSGPWRRPCPLPFAPGDPDPPLDVSSGSPPREAFPDPSERAAGLGSSAPCTAGGGRCTGPRRGPLPVGGLPDLQLRTLLEKSSAIDSYIRLWFTSSSGSNFRCPGKDRSSAKAMKPRWGPACCSLRQTATGGRCSSTEAEPAEPSELCSIFSSLFTKVLYCLQSVKNCCSACLVAYYCLLLYFSPSSPLTSDV